MNEVESTGDGMLQSFLTMGIQFLDASNEVWPEDTLIESWKHTVEEARENGDDAMRSLAVTTHCDFHEMFKSAYEKIRSRDESLMQDVAPFPLLRVLDVQNKWRTAPLELRNTIWEYLNEIVKFANMYAIYKKCPNKIMNTVNSAAMSLVSRIRNGEIEMKDINPLQLSQDMMNRISPEDLENFGSSLVTDGGGVEGIMAMMQGVMTQMEDSGMGGGDLSKLMSSGLGGDLSKLMSSGLGSDLSKLVSSGLGGNLSKLLSSGLGGTTSSYTQKQLNDLD
jgi:hypothetical protein